MQKSSRVSPGQSRDELTLAQVEMSRHKPKSSRHRTNVTQVDRAHVETSRLGPMLNRVISYLYWARLTQADVDWSLPEPMSSWVGSNPCQTQSAQTEIELCRPKPISSCCRAKSVLTDVRSSWSGPKSSQEGPTHVEQIRLGPMSSRIGPGRCQVVVESSLSWLISSQVSPGRSWAELFLAHVKTSQSGSMLS